MKRFTLLAALGLCSISLFAQDAQKEEPKEEGFVFTTVKNCLLLLSRTKAVPVLAGAIPVWPF